MKYYVSYSFVGNGLPGFGAMYFHAEGRSKFNKDMIDNATELIKKDLKEKGHNDPGVIILFFKECEW